MATTRARQKEQTRERILVAARSLFAQAGYQDTTLRQIAKAAGVSVGALFTTFEGKEDILFVIAAEGYDALAEAIDQEALTPGTARERLKRGFKAAYAFERDRLDLLMAQLGASWTWSHAFEAKSQARLAKPFGFVGRLVMEARAHGELRDDVDLALFGDMLLGVYLRNFRHAWFRNLDVETMAQMASAQIDLLFDGAGPHLGPPAARPKPRKA